MVSRRELLWGSAALGAFVWAGCAPSDVELDDGVWGEDGARYRVDGHHVVREGAWRYGGLGIGPDQLNGPSDLIPMPDGSLVVVDRGNDRLVHLGADGRRLAVLGASGAGLGQLRLPSAGCADGAGGVWVADTLNHRVQRFGPGGPRVVGGDVLEAPADVAIDALGRLHVVDKVGRCVHVFTPDGAWVSAYGDGLTVPRRVAIGAGVVWVADAVAGEVAMFSTDGGEIERRGQDELGGVPVDVHVAARGALAVHVLP